MKSWIRFPRVEGDASRQAHADLPAGTYEREIGKEGFFGPATQMYHAHPPTGWTRLEGPLRPRAFDLAKLNGIGASPWDARGALEPASALSPVAHHGEDGSSRAQRRRRRAALRP